MGLFNRTPKISKQEMLAMQKARMQNKADSLKMISNMQKSINAKMSLFDTLDSQFYTTGIKQGKYAGYMSGNSNALARNNSRATYNESPIAQSLVATFETLTVGNGLMLESQPMYDLIPQVASWGLPQRKKWQTMVEHRYKLWAKRKSVSYEKNQNRFQQEQQIFHDLLIDGEYFEIYRYSSNSKRNPMTIQIIRPEDVRTPSGSMISQGSDEENGIEYNAKGQAVAYHIWDHKTKKTVRVLREGARSGRIFVNHVKLGSNRRGVGILASMVTELTKLGDYEVLELQAAVVNALYAVWMETPEGDMGAPDLTRGLGSSGIASATEESTDDWLNDRKNLDYQEGGMIIDALPGGHKPHSFDTKRPNVNFGMFMDQVKKNLSASRGLPISILDKKFENSYSASRGELILAWYEIEKYRFNHSMTNELVYQMWMWGEVLNGKINAPGFLIDEDTRDAWTVAKWIGNQRPDIDPLKSVQAHMKEQNRGYRTGKQITAERGGGDYDSNLETCAAELKQIADMQVPFKEIDVDLDDQ